MPVAKKLPTVTKTLKSTAPAAPRASKPASAVAKVVVKRALPITAARKNPAAKPVVKPVVNAVVDSPVKAKKPKLVRDSFTIPKAEYTVLDDLKERAVKLNSPAKKSELLRAGIKALAAMSDAALLVALRAVPAIKTGRPTNS